MDMAFTLRGRAARCRQIARDYHPTVGAPLWEQARTLELEADRLDRANGRDVDLDEAVVVDCRFGSMS